MSLAEVCETCGAAPYVVCECADDFGVTDIDAVCEKTMREKNAEIERLRATLAQPHMVWAAEQHSVGVDIAAEDARLRARQQELLATIARISQSTPLDSEVAEALEQRGKLLAEIGTLRAEVSRLAHALDDALHPLHVEERPVRTELRLAKAELAQLRTHVAHNDEEYKVMKDVLRWYGAVGASL